MTTTAAYKKMFLRRFLAGAAAAGLCLGAAATDVYRAELPDGTVRYASQRLDATYAVYLRSDTAPPRAPLAATRSATLYASLDPLIQRFAQKHDVDGALVRALIEVESGFRAQAVSPKGAVGPMQLMPQTARRYGVTDRTDAAQNIDAGIHYLKDLLVLHNGNEALALASYNAGEGTVLRHDRRIPPYRETMLYVAAVLARTQAARNLNLP